MRGFKQKEYNETFSRLRILFMLIHAHKSYSICESKAKTSKLVTIFSNKWQKMRAHVEPLSEHKSFVDCYYPSQTIRQHGLGTISYFRTEVHPSHISKLINNVNLRQMKNQVSSFITSSKTQISFLSNIVSHNANLRIHV